MKGMKAMPDWSRIRILFTDVDGVLTDGSIYYGPDGQVFKRYNVYDGYGIRRLQEAGVLVVFVSADDHDMIRSRARRLGVEEVYLGVPDKGGLVREIMDREGAVPEEACYVGDDIPDLPALQAVGVPVAVANARPEIKAVSVYVTQVRGGDGAIREVAELILKARAGEEQQWWEV